MFIFNKITVTSQLPERISGLTEMSNNLWWTWNTEFLELLNQMDMDLWEKVEKNPTKFLKLISQDKLNNIINNEEILKKYDEIYKCFLSYINSKDTWFLKKFPNNAKNIIAYFSAEYGLDELIKIYTGGLGVLSADHLKSASDLGVPLIGLGLLYKKGAFHQKIDGAGRQNVEYKNLDTSVLPIEEVENVIIDVEMPDGKIYLKVWQINVGRLKLYLLDSDIEENSEEFKNITSELYVNDQEARLRQEIVLGMGGVKALEALGIDVSIYHMNEGHSSFLILELINQIMKEKEISFNLAKDIVSAKTVFTTHTPVPAGNDVFSKELIEKYFSEYWKKVGISKEEFLMLGMKIDSKTKNLCFDMGVLALKVAGKKNGVSKLHGEISRELFAEVWPNINANESPISYITNGIHTCSWLAPNFKKMYNEYLIPFWQDSIFNKNIWENIANIPNDRLWNEHVEAKKKMLALVKDNTTERLKRSGYSYEEIKDIVSKLSPDTLTIGFSRRFATYKRANLIFKDLERITQILNNENMPVQIIFAGKAHPADGDGQELIKQIHDISMKPQFKGKVFLLEDYNLDIAKKMISGVDVWLNTPRRPLEASGTSGQKAAINGVINFSILDGWWAEGYNSKNGWKIGNEIEYNDFEIQDDEDSKSVYNILEKKIIPLYYESRNDWINLMKESIISIASKFSTSRMVAEYVEKLYMPLCEGLTEYYNNISMVVEFSSWKKSIYEKWKDIEIIQLDNIENIVLTAGNNITVKCKVNLPNINKENVKVQVYIGQILDNGIMGNVKIQEMELQEDDIYKANIELTTAGEIGYTFRVMPKHPMLLDSESLNLVKWLEKR